LVLQAFFPFLPSSDPFSEPFALQLESFIETSKAYLYQILPAMLKLSQKRPREWGQDLMNVEIDPCSPHRSFTPSPGINPFSPKRVRVEESNNSNMNMEIRSISNSPRTTESPFTALTNNQNSIDRLIIPKIRAQKDKPISTASEKLFTYEEVKEIVLRVLAEKEANLRQEYEQTLQERLQEQFKNFAKFNEDYISRQLKQSDFSYLS